MKRLLIDTNIYTHAMKGDPEVVSVLQKTSEIAISVISIGELLAGFMGGRRIQQNREELEAFLDSPRVRLHPLDAETAEFYAEIWSGLKQAGSPIPTNDLWIAAVAFRHGLRLFTKDKHFRKVPGLSLVA